MTGNITLSIVGFSHGNIVRILLQSTTGLTVTWPAGTVWPGPGGTPPVIDAGPVKRCLVVIERDGTIGFLGNASVY
jgi:hypothetical protein